MQFSAGICAIFHIISLVSLNTVKQNTTKSSNMGHESKLPTANCWKEKKINSATNMFCTCVVWPRQRKQNLFPDSQQSAINQCEANYTASALLLTRAFWIRPFGGWTLRRVSDCFRASFVKKKTTIFSSSVLKIYMLVLSNYYTFERFAKP